MKKITILAFLALAACHKKGTGTTGGGGGGGAWLVGQAGLMANLRPDGSQGPGYALSTSSDLRGITCRGSDTALVAGDAGLLLRTTDAGRTWQTLDAGTTANLRDVSASWNEVYVAGDDGLRVTRDLGDTWQVIAPGAWLAVATDDGGETATALAADGGVWRYDGALSQVTALAGARAVALSHDGGTAAVVGDAGAMLRSDDGGLGWASLSTGTSADLRAVNASADGEIVAVGDGGAIVRDGVASQIGGESLDAVRIGEDGTGYAASAAGELLATGDGGATWTVLATRIPGVLDLDDVDLGQ